MTNAPENRKTHVTRILGTNRARERLDHIWVDVERIDIIKGATQIPPDLQWQGWQRQLRWHDDPDGEDEYFPEGTPSRLSEIVKVCDPTAQDVNDPDEWVPVRIIHGMRSKGGGTELMGQGFMDRFVNGSDQDNISRLVEVRKIVHYDTSIDAKAQAAFDADSSRTEFVAPGDAYNRVDRSKDESQFVDHEIITFFKPATNNLQIMGMGRQTKLRNEYLLDENGPPDGEKIGNGGINPPYRLDPFQNIVNVNFTPTVIAVFVNDSAASPFGSLSCTPLADPSTGKIKATLLENFTATIPGDTPLDIDCHAYKVSASSKSFMQTRMPSSPVLSSAGVLVFALRPGEDDAASLARAKASTRQALISLNTVEAGGIELGEVDCPDGLLWWGQTLNQCAPGTTNTWTMRFGKHRNDTNSSPRNAMVQCYPINQSPSGYTVPVLLGSTLNFYGYRIFYYRLDPAGTGQAYFVGNRDTNPGCAWNAADAGTADRPPANEDDPGSHSVFEGVLFGDPPPTILSDKPKP